MKRYLALALLTLLTAMPAVAQASPKEVVSNFYKSYSQAMKAQPGNWVESLMSAQGDNLETTLKDNLLRLAAGDPNKGEAFMDFDPFSNSQTGLETYTVGEATLKGGLAYVPVSMRLEREPGPARLRLRFVLRDSGNGWKVANVAYPAESGMAAWDLGGYLKETFKQ